MIFEISVFPVFIQMLQLARVMAPDLLQKFRSDANLIHKTVICAYIGGVQGSFIHRWCSRFVYWKSDDCDIKSLKKKNARAPWEPLIGNNSEVTPTNWESHFNEMLQLVACALGTQGVYF